MRIKLLLCLLPLVLDAAAQGTTTSVQDGDWSDPATWDCNCIPEVHNAEVLHQVRIAGNTFLMQRVHVTPVGSLVMDEYFSVVIMDTVINDGLMDLVGDIDVDWAMINNSTVHIDGVMHIDGVLTMGGPDALLTLDDIGNYDTIEGEGRICVSGLSENTGTIQGEIDFCDLTPTVTSPPFIDVNSGTVAGSVSFCAAEPCGPQSAVTNAPADSRIGPNPANDLVRIDLSSRAIVTLRDPTGRAVISHAATQTVTLDVSMLPPGIYSVSIERGTSETMHHLVIAR
jgi:hypothetical protein